MRGLALNSNRRDVLALSAMAVLVTVANMWKPFHIDDTAHLVIAQWIAENPLQPMSGMLNWGGIDEPIHRTNQPHLFFYLMAGWGRVFGWSEVAQHALLAIFSVACIVFTFRLARRLVPDHALWATAILALSPAFVVSQNMMVDIPLLAVWLRFFDTLADRPAVQQQRTRQYLIAALAASCALLIKYSSLALLPILAFVIIWDGRWRLLVVLLVPVAVLGAWSGFNIADYGGIHILQRSSGARDWLQPARAAIAWVLILGGVTPLGLAWLAAQRRFGRWTAPLAAAIAAGVAALAALVALSAVTDAVADRLLWLAFALNGGLAGIALLPTAWTVVLALVQRAPRSEETRLLVILFAWLACGAGFYILLAPFSAVRHVLSVLPALVLLVCFAMRSSLGARTKFWTLLGTIVLSIGVAAGDFRFAQFHKDQALRIGRDPAIAAATTNGTAWTSGHWGWQWYADRQGLRQIDYRSSRPSSGDLFVEATGMDRHYRKDRLDLAFVKSISERRAVLNPVCTARPSRFYSSSHEDGPWSLSMDCAHRINVYRVR